MRVPGHILQAVQKINKAAKNLGIELDAAAASSILETAPGKSNTWKEANAARKLAEEAGLSERHFQEAMKVRNRRHAGGYVSFETWMQQGQNLASDTGCMEMEQDNIMATEASNEHVRSILSEFLKPNEMEALSWRYGLMEDAVEAESPKERANRQFAEMEDQLFGSSAPMAASTCNAVNLKELKESKKAVKNMPIAKGRWGEAMTFIEVGKRMEVSAEYTRKLCHRALNKLKQAAKDGRLEPALLF
jgi:DNA-directed RNA polymerase sigma subunit (sigma70/sigma32)